MRTKIDPITGMKVEVEEGTQSCDSNKHPRNPAPKTTRSRRLPPIIVGGHKDWDNLVTMMKDDSYQLPDEKKYHVVLRGFCENTNTNKIVEEIENLRSHQRSTQ